MKTLLQLIGLRSTCCNASIVSWHFDKAYCAACDHWVGQASSTQSMQVTTARLKVPVVQ